MPLPAPLPVMDIVLVVVMTATAVACGVASFWFGYRKAMREIEGKTRHALQVKLSEIRVERNEANGAPGK